MSRIGTIVQEKLAAGKKALIPYLVAGDPDLETSLRLMHGLVAAGADIIELGVPFSDPSADGEVIQRAVERALAAGTTLKGVLALVARFRETDDRTPVVLMGYLNPVEYMGYEEFAGQAASAGVDGVLLVDMPPAEAVGFKTLMSAAGMDVVFLVAPTTSEKRAKLIAESCSGYLYYVSLKGVTGAAISDSESIRSNVARLRTFTDIPIVIGFGIKDPESALRMGALADGVIIGSALVDRIAELSGMQQIDEKTLNSCVSLIAEVRKHLDGSS